MEIPASLSVLRRWGYYCLILILAAYQASGTCSWPAIFDTSTWLDSQQGQIQFTSSTDLSGFDLLFYGSTINTFTCQEETFDTNGIILIRSTTAAFALNADWYTYICLEFTELVPGVSYRYYRQHAQQNDIGQHRIKVEINDFTKTIAEECDAANGATGGEFVTIIKQGSEAASYITCPSVLLGRFEFNYTSSDGTESCNDPADTEQMNVCTDKTQLAFDEPCSGQSIVYASGSVYCVASVTSGSDTYIQFYNGDASVDDSTTYRFSCMAISSDSLSATIVYNNCTNHQTSTYVPRSHDQTVIGASISFSPYVFCQKPKRMEKKKEEDRKRAVEESNGKKNKKKTHQIKIYQEKRVELNVSGKKFQTTTMTLKASSGLLSEIADMNISDSIFIDRDNTHFGLILNFLRYKLQGETMATNMLPTTRREIRELLMEVKYYQLSSMEAILKSRKDQLYDLNL